MEQTGIYIHIPFCKSKCAYCSFYSVTDESLRMPYIKTLKEELKSYSGVPADSVFFGGGTPSVLGEELCGILDEIKSVFCLDKDSEMTVEANPDTVTEELLTAYRKAGINRLSFGVQSFCGNELALLSRRHNAERAKKSVITAKNAGFENISIDLMLAIPEQTKESLIYSLKQAVELGVTHLSLYSLKLEQGTPLYLKKDTLLRADEDEEWEMYRAACDYLRSDGFEHYEISNFALPGYECRHNLKYWRLSPYLGFGPAAHSLFDGIRFHHEPDLNGYFAGIPVVSDGPYEPLSEYVMLGLRLSEGIRFKKLSSLLGKPLPDRFFILANRLVSAGLAVKTSKSLALTEKGFWISNGIITEVLTALE